MPREAPVRAIWWLSVVARRGAAAPKRVTDRIAPPLTFNFALSMPCSRWAGEGLAANASFKVNGEFRMAKAA